ncbi:gamma-glutamyltransferase [bacterium]|nr:gamma-glutamyltransferase [bacterium]
MGWMLIMLGASLAGGELVVASRPAGNPHQTRSVVMAKHGMVATSHPLAVEAGLSILRAGGNAVDAAIAANAALGVVEPMSCGLGGDLFAIVWENKSQKLYGLNASGRSPYAATREYFLQKGMNSIPGSGPLSWSVPGCVDGWNELHQRFGSKSLEEILAPAIGYGEEGFPLVELIGAFWQVSAPNLARLPDVKKTFLPDGKLPRVGQTLRNPYQAATLRMIAKEGRDAFYRGPIAQQIVDYSQKVGGLFTIKDFEDHHSDWVAPVSTNYRGYDIWELPPNGQGIAVLTMLNILEKYDIRAMGPHSPEFLHLFVEAKKLAYEDRARWYADPDFAKDVSIARLISKEYADQRRALIDPQKGAMSYEPGDARLKQGDTVYLTVVDRDRNVVSLIESNFAGWGSGHVPGDLGFPLQNRGSLFTLEEGHPNVVAPHKRPFHTIIPAMATKNGKPWLSFGVMGGDMQPQGHVQVLLNIIDHQMNIQLAGEAIRCRHDGSSTPTGGRMTDGGEVLLEAGLPETTLKHLRDKGHRVRLGNPSEFGGYQAILIDEENGMLQGASEHRKDGAAAGY